MSVNNEIEGDSPKEIMMGSLVVHREVPTRVGVVCLPAFKINKGPGAWVLWPDEDYTWTHLNDMILASEFPD